MDQRFRGWWDQSGGWGGVQGHGGLRGSPCETKQSTSCSLESGRSFWLQFCLERHQQSWDTKKELTQRMHANKLTYSHIHARWHIRSAQAEQWAFLVEVILEAWEETSQHPGKRKSETGSNPIWVLYRLDPLIDNRNDHPDRKSCFELFKCLDNIDISLNSFSHFYCK